MTVIVCLDNNNGMMFNRRRQSRDRVLISDIMDSIEGKTLYINNFSKTLFQKYDNVAVEPDFLNACPNDGTAFVENRNVDDYFDKIDVIITYLWNRDYPSDKKFDIDLESGEWIEEERTDFVGYSHDQITKIKYIKRK